MTIFVKIASVKYFDVESECLKNRMNQDLNILKHGKQENLGRYFMVSGFENF